MAPSLHSEATQHSKTIPPLTQWQCWAWCTPGYGWPSGLPRHTAGSRSTCCYQNPQIAFCKTALQPLVPHFFPPCHLYSYVVWKVKFSLTFQFQNFSKLFSQFMHFCKTFHQNNWILLLLSKFLLQWYLQHLDLWFVLGSSELRNGWSPLCPWQRVQTRWSLECLPIQATL